MNYEILRTGSKGNCIIVENSFALDIGVPYKLVEPYLKNIKLIFISHEHGDHFNKATVKKIAYNYPNIVFVWGSRVLNNYEERKALGINHLLRVHSGSWFDLGMCSIRLDYLYHDVPNYALSLTYKGKTLFYATDTSKIDHISAPCYDLYLIEGNYLTDDELDQKIIEAHEKGEFTYLDRVRHTHLSQLQALNWLDENMCDNSQYVFIHEHVGDDNYE